MTHGFSEVEQALRRVPAWSRAVLQIRPAGISGTSRVFVVAAGGTEYTVRIPAEQIELLGIHRDNEAEGAERAAALGIGPRVFGRLPGAGTVISERLAGHLGTPEQLVERLGDVVSLIRRFHESGPLRAAFPIHRVVEWHVRDAGARGVIAPSSYERLHQQSRRIERAFSEAPTAPVPCHNDLVPSNVLFAGGQLRLLGFEFAGMNDVFFDLANLSVNASFNTAVDHELLRRYFGTETRSAWARLQLMKVMSEFRAGMWAVLRQAISPRDSGLVADADEHLRNCEHVVAAPAFEQWLEDARRPPLPHR